jgi:HSP20 family protein
MERMFDEFQRSVDRPSSTAERSFNPAVDVTEAADHFFMTVDLPGFKKEDIKIELNDNVLTISGERRREQKADDNKNHRFERSYGSFARSFTLPTTVTNDKVEANYEDGVLNLYLPKTPVAKARTIEIQAKNGGFFDKLIGNKKDVEVKPSSSSH